MGRKERGPRTEPQETLTFMTFMEEWTKGGCQHRWRRIVERSEGGREREYITEASG